MTLMSGLIYQKITICIFEGMIITSEPKIIDELMNHLRDDCHIKIEEGQKQDLINYGYYHGYKGYRFYQKSTNRIPYTDFKELVAVIEYDNHMKAELYSSLMFLETAIKNVVPE